MYGEFFFVTRPDETAVIFFADCAFSFGFGDCYDGHHPDPEVYP